MNAREPRIPIDPPHSVGLETDTPSSSARLPEDNDALLSGNLAGRGDTAPRRPANERREPARTLEERQAAELLMSLARGIHLNGPTVPVNANQLRRYFGMPAQSAGAQSLSPKDHLAEDGRRRFLWSTVQELILARVVSTRHPRQRDPSAEDDAILESTYDSPLANTFFTSGIQLHETREQLQVAASPNWGRYIATLKGTRPSTAFMGAYREGVASEAIAIDTQGELIRPRAPQPPETLKPQSSTALYGVISEFIQAGIRDSEQHPTMINASKVSGLKQLARHISGAITAEDYGRQATPALLTALKGVAGGQDPRTYLEAQLQLFSDGELANLRARLGQATTTEQQRPLQAQILRLEKLGDSAAERYASHLIKRIPPSGNGDNIIRWSQRALAAAVTGIVTPASERQRQHPSRVPRAAGGTALSRNQTSTHR